MTTWIEQQVRARALRHLFLFLAVTAFIAWLLSLNAAYWHIFFHGPPPISITALEADAAASSNFQPLPTQFGAIAGTNAQNTGIYEQTTYEGVIKQVSAEYYALTIGQKLLIVKSSKAPAATVSGILSPMPFDVQQLVLPDDSSPELKAAVYPLLLDTNYREGGYAAIFWVALFELIFGFAGVFALLRLSGKKVHPAITRAAPWGSLSQISTDLQHELAGTPIAKSGGWVLTQHYLLCRKLFTFDLFRIEDLLWAYVDVTKVRIHFIPFRNEYAIKLFFTNGTAKVPCKKSRSSDLLQTIRTLAPWAVFGFSQEINQLYTNSREEFAAEIQKQKSAPTG